MRRQKFENTFNAMLSVKRCAITVLQPIVGVEFCEKRLLGLQTNQFSFWAALFVWFPEVQCC